MSNSRFENALLGLFLRAEAEGRRDTAEHLMRALEAHYASLGTEAGPLPVSDGHGVAAERRRLAGAAEDLPQQGRAAAPG